MVDAVDSKSTIFGCEGSSPSAGTIKNLFPCKTRVLLCKNNLPKNDIIQGILSTYLQEKEINVFFDKIFNYDTEDPNVDAKLNQIKALIIKKLTYLISLLFNADKKAWFVSLKITQNIQKANSHYQHLLSLLGQIISYETIKDIPEVLIEEFCQNILTTNELMTQIMKVIEKNF